MVVSPSPLACGFFLTVQAGSGSSPTGRRERGKEDRTTLPSPVRTLLCDTSLLHSTGQNLSHMVKSRCQGSVEARRCSGQPRVHLGKERRGIREPGG